MHSGINRTVTKRLSRIGFVFAAACLSAVVFAAERQLPPQSLSLHSGTPRRIALAIGNNLYPLGPLKNAVNDARSVARVLADIGFQVTQLENLNRADTERAIRRFASEIRGGDTAFFYYAGHGMQIEGVNYLIPTDFEAEDEISGKDRGVSVDVVRERMEGARAALSILVIDACRNNPFRVIRAGSKGLAPMEGGQGTMIVLATGPGKTASDNPADANGLFTKHLVATIRKPGLKATEVFDEVKAAVYAESGGQQRPWVFSDVIGDFYLASRPPATKVTLLPPSLLFGTPTPSTSIYEALLPGSSKEMPEPKAAVTLKSRDWDNPWGVYAVRLSSFPGRLAALEDAAVWQRRLSVPVFVVAGDHGVLGTLHHVVAGKFQNFEDALSLFRRLRTEGVTGLSTVYRVTQQGK